LGVKITSSFLVMVGLMGIKIAAKT